MANLVFLTRSDHDGERVIVNLDRVMAIYSHREGSRVVLSDVLSVLVVESPIAIYNAGRQ